MMYHMSKKMSLKEFNSMIDAEREAKGQKNTQKLLTQRRPVNAANAASAAQAPPAGGPDATQRRPAFGFAGAASAGAGLKVNGQPGATYVQHKKTGFTAPVDNNTFPPLGNVSERTIHNMGDWASGIDKIVQAKDLEVPVRAKHVRRQRVTDQDSDEDDYYPDPTQLVRTTGDKEWDEL